MKLIKLIPENTKIPFMGARLITFPISMVLIAGSFLLMAVFGLNYGIDFAGGTLVEVRSHVSPADLHKIRTELGEIGLVPTAGAVAGALAALRADAFAGPVSLEWEKQWHPYLPSLDAALTAAAARRWW